MHSPDTVPKQGSLQGTQIICRLLTGQLALPQSQPQQDNSAVATLASLTNQQLAFPALQKNMAPTRLASGGAPLDNTCLHADVLLGEALCAHYSGALTTLP